MKSLPSLLRAVAVCAVLSVVSAGCGTNPPPAPTIAAGPTFEQKMSWILRLEDQRMLRDPTPPPPPAPAAPAKGRTAIVAPPPPPPDLTRLLQDSEARVRRRAALAIGRVGLADGVPPLVALLTSEQDPEVRQMAAFALGLLRDRSARDPLLKALADPSPLVQGSAAQALGLIGDAADADAIGRMVAQIVQSGALAQTPPEDDEARRDTPAAAARLGIDALVALNAYPPLAAAVLDAGGQPKVHWWPVAFALQRLQDRRGVPALLAFTKDANAYARAFAVKGLGQLKEPSAVAALMPLLSSGDRSVLIETITALGAIGDPSAAAPIIKFVQASDTDPHVRLAAIGALGGMRANAGAVTDTLLDLITNPLPAIRSAALRASAALDPDGFVTVLSGLDPDPQWSVRAALASTLATLPPEIGLPRLHQMLGDTDQRVVPAVLDGLVRLKAPDAATLLVDHLKADDPAVRAAAAAGVGELKPSGGDAALAAAYQFSQRDATYIARAAALAALARYGAAAATPVLRSALADKDWAVRVRAVQLLKRLDPTAGADLDTQIRPAPTTVPADTYQAPRLVNPPVSTQIYIDTDRGTIQVELAVLDAPLTVENFVTLARKGFFNGLAIHRVVPDFVIQDGDPRGDGEGGPGYSIRDELNERPYLRGTVGMALDPWPDTGGSQWFITHSPQPQLDARYTVFGRVVAGMDVVDKIQQFDVIRAVRVWDGTTMSGGKNQKGGERTAPFYLDGRGRLAFLPGLLLPALGFLRHCLLSPPSSGMSARAPR
ncbi:MAG TPA: HEAT repeat domain-containing protein [Vicinamibacterales bacterium]|nr:HEAT repeat domain-containing protein [Vicinamibacterales bacterium]